MRRRLLWLLGTLMAAALLLLSHSPGPHTSSDQGLSMGVVAGRVLPVPQGLAVPHRLRLGLELEDLRALDLSTKTFRAEGQLLLAWDEALNRRLQTEGIEPLRLVRFVNQVEMWNSELEATAPPRPLPEGGGWSQALRFEGLFYVNDLDLRSAPFLRVSLPLILEVADHRLAIEKDGVLLEPPPDSRRLVGGGVAMAGFRFVGSELSSALHRSEDPFEAGSPRSFSRLVLRLRYRTDDLAAALRWVLPLLLVMAVVLLAPSLDSDRDELSFGLPSAGLLTLVVMQEGYRAQVPPTPYLTFLDQLYAYSYAVAVAVFLLFVWAGNQRARARPEQAEAVLARINRLCTVAQVSALLGYGVILLWNRLA